MGDRNPKNKEKQRKQHQKDQQVKQEWKKSHTHHSNQGQPLNAPAPVAEDKEQHKKAG